MGPSPDADPSPECEAPESVPRSQERYAGGRRPEGERKSPKAGPPSSCRSGSSEKALDMPWEWPLWDAGGEAKAAPVALPIANGGMSCSDDWPSEVHRLAWVTMGAADPSGEGPSA